MTQRTTKTQLRAKVEGLQKQGIDIDIHWAYGQPRCTTRDQGRDLSPRLPMGQMSVWLHGFACALGMAGTILNQIEDFITNNYNEPMSSSDKAEMLEHIVDLMDGRAPKAVQS